MYQLICTGMSVYIFTLYNVQCALHIVQCTIYRDTLFNVYMRIGARICICVWTRLNVYVDACICSYVDAFVYVCMYAYARA